MSLGRKLLNTPIPQDCLTQDESCNEQEELCLTKKEEPCLTQEKPCLSQEKEYEEDSKVQRLRKEERETAVVFNEADGYWQIYSAIPHHIRKFDKLNYEVTFVDYYEDGVVAGKFYKVPKNTITFRDISKKTEISEEERMRRSERAKKIFGRLPK